MTWILSRSTSSWILVRACAGTPPESATISSILRPASESLCSFRYCTRARSMSIPPEASGPVLTVTRPTRIGPVWLFTGKDVAASAAPAACTKRLRLNVMRFPLVDLVEELLIGDHPAEAARDVLQAQHVEILSVHASDAVGEHDHPIIEVERGEGGIQHAGVGVDAHEDHALHAQRIQKLPQVRAVKAIQALLVVDHVIAFAIELGDDLRPGRALDVVLAHRALAARGQAVGLGLRGVQ